MSSSPDRAVKSESSFKFPLARLEKGLLKMPSSRRFWQGHFLVTQQIGSKLPVIPINSLVVRHMTFEVPTMQKAQAEAPCLLRLRQAHQQIVDPLISGLQFTTMSLADRAEAEDF